MKELYINQKVFSLAEKFTIKDAQEQDVYYVEGSFMRIPKTFTIMNTTRDEIAFITKKAFAFLPKFFVEVDGREVLTIKKEFSFFKSRYTIEGTDIEVQGNWWDMEFQIVKCNEVVGRVKKAWFTWGDSYKVEILDEDMEAIIIAIVIAIDCVKADESASASSAANG